MEHKIVEEYKEEVLTKRQKHEKKMREEEAARKRGDSKIGFGVSGVSPKPSPKPSPMASPSTSPRRKISAARSG